MNALSILFGILMFATALFLILLVLVQRGRGGGLSGALGGMGGQSAFGTKAGDLFTRITIFVAAFWILLCIAAILVLNRQAPVASRPAGGATEFVPAGPSKSGKEAAEKQTAEQEPGGGAAGESSPGE